MLRILQQIQKREKVKRTPLGMYCNMSYDRLTHYLAFLVELELISITEESEGKFVSITTRGNKVISALSHKN